MDDRIIETNFETLTLLVGLLARLLCIAFSSVRARSSMELVSATVGACSGGAVTVLQYFDQKRISCCSLDTLVMLYLRLKNLLQVLRFTWYTKLVNGGRTSLYHHLNTVHV